MANSRKPNLPEEVLLGKLEQFLASRSLATGKALVVALSGGLDSVVLLHLLQRLFPRDPIKSETRSASALTAIHINHQLQAPAAQWAEFCSRLCQQWGIPLQCVSVEIQRRGGQSLEALAREARYRAFDAIAADGLLLAHHADDQAETVLLQLLRGAGVSGLSAMPAAQQRNGKWWLRPLLDATRQELEAYARQHQLQWIEDPSNQQLDFDRNYLRHAVLPLLTQRFPAAVHNIGRSARHLAEAQRLLDEVACQDNCINGDALSLPCWQLLSAEHQRNVLRYWLRHSGQVSVSARLLMEIQQQLQHARSDSALQIDLPGRQSIRRYRERAFLVPCLPPLASAWQQNWTGVMPWQVPDLSGTLHFRPQTGSGLRASLLQDTAALQLRLRSGKEFFKPFANRPSKTLQHWFQEAGIPPWLRTRLPLLYLGGELVWVAQLGVAASMQAGTDEAGYELNWQPES